MPRHRVDTRAEAVALAAVVGAEAASQQMGLDVRSVRKWQAAAGYRPELDAPTDSLQALYDLSVARATADVVSGKIRGSALMTVVGIARDKLDRASRWAAARNQADADLATDDDGIGPLTHAATDRLMAYIHALPDEQREIAQRVVREAVDQARDYQREHGAPPLQSPAEADARIAEALDRFTASLDEPGSLDAYAARFAEADAREARRNEQRSRAQWWLDDATADLLVEADAVLEGPAA